MSRNLVAAALASVLLAAPALAQGIEIHEPYAFASRPGAPTGGAYMVIENHTDTDDRLVSASAPVAQMVQIHANIIDDDGVAHMVEHEHGIALPAGGAITLARGGDHVMFMGITEPFVDGLVIPLTLHFEVAGDLLVEVPVDLARLADTGDGNDMGDHDMTGHDMHGMDDSHGD
ncbi:MAG: copper chaperone PCu(A)C [Rubellimicrobium sp.]|nr:copper chaperone PCu(A)C [Rubellimicrobium sp.]